MRTADWLDINTAETDSHTNKGSVITTTTHTSHSQLHYNTPHSHATTQHTPHTHSHATTQHTSHSQSHYNTHLTVTVTLQHTPHTHSHTTPLPVPHWFWWVFPHTHRRAPPSSLSGQQPLSWWGQSLGETHTFHLWSWLRYHSKYGLRFTACVWKFFFESQG